MPRELFDTTGDRHGSPSGRSRWYTVPFSILVHASIVVVAVGVPLLATDVLPTPGAVLAFVAPPPAPQAVAPPTPTSPPRPVTIAPDVNPGAAPTEAPSTLADEPPPLPTPLVGLHETSTPPVAAPLARFEAPPPPEPAPATTVRPGGNIREPRKTYDVTPTYPTVAQAARVEGTVILEATIARDGSVKDVRVLRSIALLDMAAVDAVKQWRYTPTLLNGQPVDVVMTVTVRFSLAR